MYPTLKEKEEELIETFSAYDDWMDRYQYLVDLGAKLEPLDEKDKNEITLIHGCQSQAWLTCEEHDGRVYYKGESDAIIVRGIVALLISVVSGCLATEVAGMDFSFIDKIGLREHLSPTRSNGLVSMMHQIKAYAMKSLSKDVLK